MTIDVPVYLVGRAGTPDADNPLCSPCIKCSVTDRAGLIHSGEILGMLDSGAYPNTIDEPLWARLGLPVVGSDTLHSVHDVKRVPICEALLIIHTHNGLKVLSARFSVVPLRQQGHMYDLILGRQVLTFGSFGFSRERTAWHFSLPED